MLQNLAGRGRAVWIRRRKSAGVVQLPGPAKVDAFPFKSGRGDFQRFVVAVRDKQVARGPAAIQRRFRLRRAEAGGQHCLPVAVQTLLQCGQGLHANHYRTPDARHIDDRGGADAGPDQRRVRLLVRTGPQLGKLYFPKLALMAQILLRPGFDQQFLRFVQAGDAVGHSDAKAQIFVVVVGGTASGADNQASVAQIVQQGGLHRQAHGVMKGQFGHREPDFDAGGAGRHRSAQHQRIGVRRRPVKMMLG